MTYYTHLGQIPPKRHTQFRQPNGTLYHEELIGNQGFSGSHSLLYHLRPPTELEQVTVIGSTQLAHEDAGALRPRHFRTAERGTGEDANYQVSADAIASRIPLLTNTDLTLAIAQPNEPMTYWYRFAHGDELLFIHQGRGQLETQLGELHYGPGDYLIIPAGVLWRLIPDVDVAQTHLILEVTGHLHPPSQYLSPQGKFLEQAPYCERDIRPPERLLTHDEVGIFEVRVKARGRLTQYLYSHHPLDIVGWDGNLWPYAFNIEDFEPITGRIHQPPSVHQTFAGPNFVVCSFVPRLFDYHPQGIPAPYNHANVDSDEVIYYVEGQFMSRKGIEPGSITFHPSGLPHGPHPGTYAASIGQSHTEELAVMIDTFRPLQVTTQARAMEDVDYVHSWRPSQHKEPMSQ
ncbi:homogentisate 1,2-dioxygenase [Leptothoe spongobia]|uniref:Homogentisate 1,2-dioxygenase n=1 Tax=Leptothoe spongobia TAU-MAC 1115 TaxID=1967444 RepID=A0A947DDF3_9CYAN|nr:homogentisate 1,2-dioxygenase [Leptothoe spongobia]MBT9314825.1 homogentisate 1,2-dioxygenase [Leptothoe spongobia TAU-MAC 1115]